MQYACSLSRLDMKGSLRPPLKLPAYILKASPHAQVLAAAARHTISVVLKLHFQRVLQFLAQVEEGDIDGAIEQVIAVVSAAACVLTFLCSLSTASCGSRFICVACLACATIAVVPMAQPQSCHITRTIRMVGRCASCPRGSNQNESNV